MARNTTATINPVKTTRGRGPDGRYISIPVNATTASPKRDIRKAKAIPHGVVPQPTITKLKNHVALVIDASSSMTSLRSQMIQVINSFIDTIRAGSQQADQETTITMCVFNDAVTHHYVAADVQTLKPIKPHEYSPDGMTALFDGVGMTIEKLLALKDASDENTSFLVLPITDGEENCSMKYNPKQLIDTLKNLESDGRWTIAFQVPAGNRRKFCTQFKISEENVREWEISTRGLAETQNATTQGVGGFFDARQQGKKKVDKFFTDLSKISDAEIKKKLVNVSKQFRLLQVDKESGIKDFVESKTGKPYVTGSAYYELTKPETVQPQKDVLIVERGKEKVIFGGPAARQLLGLPQGEHAKVTPANLSKYRPLIKSTSPNRVLVRGTILAVDLSKVTPDKSHFDTSVLDPK